MIVSEAQVQRVVRIYQVQGAQKVKAGPGGGRPRPDRVTLSKEAREIQKVREALAGMPDVREAKVAELRKALDAGTYRVDSADVAEKMFARFLVDRLAADLPSTQDAEGAPGGREGD
ncbi:flagellar biosynthesis anti-sigma factor FlgM [Limnochorda pilosa]|uniref:Negative regulator of flagellin synthesis n=1 Tax=Limnochorda pilosa TaxID=1555112 RepID=A0A0K2SNV8_LIMPI|nr:flagellar biosynthesis anti-sigma factor FlgM [Limnochorda pilosa]BAS28800.1 anti-sigma-28 factor FlgM [Limnochorda pilosa]